MVTCFPEWPKLSRFLERFDIVQECDRRGKKWKIGFGKKMQLGMRSASPGQSGQWTCPMAFTPHRRYHQQNWNFWDQPGPQRTTLPNSGPANHHKKIASTDSDSLESHFMWYIQTLAFSYGFYCVFACPCLLLHTSESQRSWLQINGEPTVIKDYAAERFQKNGCAT